MPAEHTDDLAVAAWSLGHGRASLWLDGQLKHYTNDPVAAAVQITALIESILTSR